LHELTPPAHHTPAQVLFVSLSLSLSLFLNIMKLWADVELSSTPREQHIKTFHRITCINLLKHLLVRSLISVFRRSRIKSLSNIIEEHSVLERSVNYRYYIHDDGPVNYAAEPKHPQTRKHTESRKVWWNKRGNLLIYRSGHKHPKRKLQRKMHKA
jgi:hypothetical protein